MASEEMSFENVDDGRMDDGYLPILSGELKRKEKEKWYVFRTEQCVVLSYFRIEKCQIIMSRICTGN